MSVGFRLADYLGHMLEAATVAAEYVAGTDKAAFFADRRTQQAVLMNIVILGEAAAKVIAEHPAFAEQQPGIPWRTHPGHAQPHRARLPMSCSNAASVVRPVGTPARHARASR